MGLIIDSSIIIAAEKGVIDFSKLPSDRPIYISVVTVTELLVGVLRANTEERRIKRSAFVEHVINSIGSIEFGVSEARIYAQVLQDLFVAGITIGTHDAMIGATAITHGYCVLTMNGKDFKRIKGLSVLTDEDIKK
jgi:hypothetical protein